MRCSIIEYCTETIMLLEFIYQLTVFLIYQLTSFYVALHLYLKMLHRWYIAIATFKILTVIVITTQENA